MSLIRNAIREAKRQRKANQGDEIQYLGETLSTGYGLSIEAREGLRGALEALEKAVEPAAAVAAKAEVERAQAALSTREKEVGFAERRAQRKYPRIFDFFG